MHGCQILTCKQYLKLMVVFSVVTSCVGGTPVTAYKTALASQFSKTKTDVFTAVRTSDV
jgi:hypothetical protein